MLLSLVDTEVKSSQLAEARSRFCPSVWQTSADKKNHSGCCSEWRGSEARSVRPSRFEPPDVFCWSRLSKSQIERKERKVLKQKKRAELTDSAFPSWTHRHPQPLTHRAAHVSVEASNDTTEGLHYPEILWGKVFTELQLSMKKWTFSTRSQLCMICKTHSS